MTRNNEPGYLPFIQRLRNARISKGLSQTQLAARMTDDRGYKWHQSTVVRIESGARMLTVCEYLAITELLGMDRAECFTPTTT